MNLRLKSSRLKKLAAINPTLLIVALLGLMLSACGGGSSVVKHAALDKAGEYRYQIGDISSSAPDVPEEFIRNLRKYLEKDLSKKGVLSTGKSSKSVNINITDFKMPGRGSRLVLGMLAGKDFVTSKVTVTDSGSNKKLGDAEIESSDKLNSGGPELFTNNHAKAISNFLLGKR